MTILILTEGQGRRLINYQRLQFLDISESKARHGLTPHPVSGSRQTERMCLLYICGGVDSLVWC